MLYGILWQWMTCSLSTQMLVLEEALWTVKQIHNQNKYIFQNGQMDLFFHKGSGPIYWWWLELDRFSEAHIFDYLVPNWWNYMGSMRCSLIGGGISLGWVLRIQKTCIIPSVSSLNFLFEDQDVTDLLPIMDSSSLKSWAQLNTLFCRLPWLWCVFFCHSNLI